jgi:hypothetical protein
LYKWPDYIKNGTDFFTKSSYKKLFGDNNFYNILDEHENLRISRIGLGKKGKELFEMIKIICMIKRDDSRMEPAYHEITYLRDTDTSIFIEKKEKNKLDIEVVKELNSFNEILAKRMIGLSDNHILGDNNIRKIVKVFFSSITKEIK